MRVGASVNPDAARPGLPAYLPAWAGVGAVVRAGPDVTSGGRTEILENCKDLWSAPSLLHR